MGALGGEGARIANDGRRPSPTEKGRPVTAAAPRSSSMLSGRHARVGVRVRQAADVVADGASSKLTGCCTEREGI